MSPREKRSARDVALDALMQVDKANAWSDEALRRLIAQNGLDSRDAAFATRLCYGVMQNRMLLDYYIGCWCAQKPERLEPVIRSILRIGGYQILFMDRVPHRVIYGGNCLWQKAKTRAITKTAAPCLPKKTAPSILSWGKSVSRYRSISHRMGSRLTAYWKM